MRKCAILINNYSIFFTAFYMIFKITTRLALKCRLFHAFINLEICLINH